MNTDQLKQELLKAAEGLVMQSEAEEVFEFFFHEKPDEPFTAETVVEWDGKPAGTAIQVLEVEDFLRPMTNPQPDAGEAKRQNADRVKQLEMKLKSLLRNAKAYKVSQTTMPVYLIGETENGDYAGLKTIVVEA